MANTKRRSNSASTKTRGTQGKKDSRTKRVNFDNEREDKFDKEVHIGKTNACNDVSWYTSSPELLKAAASIPSYYTNGASLPFNSAKSVPGILACYWNPNLGPSENTASTGVSYPAINQAANSMYSFVVHANSRNKSYDAPDLMMLVLAGAQLFSAIAHGIRVYGVMRYYEEQNLYLPKALVRAMGFDYDDLKSNLARMWFDINEMISRSSQIWIPNTMPIIERWFWLNSNVYTDATTPKSQYYLTVPMRFYQYDETKYTTGGALVPTTWQGNTVQTWSQYVTIVNGMFNALLDSQDRGIIFGDILKAYGQEKIYTLSPIPADYMVTPVYDQEVLTQLENSTAVTMFLGDIHTSPSFHITIEGSVNNSAPTTTNGLWLPSTSVLNYHNTQEMTPEMNMVATRLKAHHVIWRKDFPSTGDYTYWINCSGTEYISHYIMYYYSGGTLQTSILSSCRQGSITVANLRDLMSFEWHPWLYLNASAPTNFTFADEMPDDAIGEFDNYTLIDTPTLDKMHTAATYSLFGVPQGI